LRARRQVLPGLEVVDQLDQLLAPVTLFGEIAADRLDLGAGLVVPLGLEQEPGDALTLVELVALDLPEDGEDRRLRDQLRRLDSLPEAVDTPEADDLRAEVVDRLPHLDPLVARPCINEVATPLVVPRLGVNTVGERRHDAPVDLEGLLDSEPLEPACGIGAGGDLLDLRVADDDPLEPIGNLTEGVVLVDGPLVDRLVLEQDLVARCGGREHDQGGQEGRETSSERHCGLPPRGGLSPRAAWRSILGTIRVGSGFNGSRTL
jgi:hypothetical protein